MRYQYLTGITGFGDLKKKFRALAVLHHPDKGGDTEIMKTINNEFARLYKIWENVEPKVKDTTGYTTDYTGATARQYTEYVYNEYRFKGSNYTGQMPSQVCDIMRQWLKETYPRYKFSVRRHHYSTICIDLLEADFQAFVDDSKNNAYVSINHYHIDNETTLSERALEVMKNVLSYLNSYNFDDSDSQSDYYHNNFYISLSIGRSTYPYKIVLPQLKQEKGKPAPVFKRPEGEAQKAVRRAMNKAVFEDYTSNRYGLARLLGEYSFYEDGRKVFYPFSYGGYKTALKRKEKLESAGIVCEIIGNTYYYIKFIGFTPETEFKLAAEEKTAEQAEKAWNAKYKVESQPVNETLNNPIKMKTIIIGNIKCVVQAYKKDEFVNLCPIQNSPSFEEEVGTTTIYFDRTPEFFTGGRENEAWKNFIAQIDIDALAIELNTMFANVK